MALAINSVGGGAVTLGALASLGVATKASEDAGELLAGSEMAGAASGADDKPGAVASDMATVAIEDASEASEAWACGAVAAGLVAVTSSWLESALVSAGAGDALGAAGRA